MVSTAKTPPGWLWIPTRVLLLTLLLTLLSLVISLFLGIVGVLMVAWLRGAAPDMTIAYRYIAFPTAVVAGAVALVWTIKLEVRNHRQSQALASIERAS